MSTAPTVARNTTIFTMSGRSRSQLGTAAKTDIRLGMSDLAADFAEPALERRGADRGTNGNAGGKLEREHERENAENEGHRSLKQGDSGVGFCVERPLI